MPTHFNADFFSPVGFKAHSKDSFGANRRILIVFRILFTTSITGDDGDDDQ